MTACPPRDPTPERRAQRLRGHWRPRVGAGCRFSDAPFLYERRPLWDITVIVLSIGGIVLGATTVWPSLKRLARQTRRFGRFAGRIVGM